MRKLLVPAIAAALLATAPIAFAASQHAMGMVKMYDSKTMMLTLDNGQSYMLPKTFKDPGLKAGQKVDVTWTQQGKNKVADSVMMAK